MLRNCDISWVFTLVSAFAMRSKNKRLYENKEQNNEIENKGSSLNEFVHKRNVNIITAQAS